MSIDEQARERLAQQRQQAETLQDNMLNRAEEEIQGDQAASQVAEQARENLTEQRLQADQLQDNMLRRSEAEVGISEP